MIFLLSLLIFGEIGYVEPWGKDESFFSASPLSEKLPKTSIPSKVAQKVIGFHKSVLTQTTGPRSAFRPSSSSYMLEAIQSHGFLKGYIMGCDRLLRENNAPWVYRLKMVDGERFKWDPPPKKN